MIRMWSPNATQLFTFSRMGCIAFLSKSLLGTRTGKKNDQNKLATVYRGIIKCLHTICLFP